MDLLNGTGNGTIKPLKVGRSLFQEMFKQVVDHKYFFLLSIAISLLLAYLSIRYTKPVYLVKTSVLIKETKSPTNNTQNILYGEDEAASAEKNHIQEEIAILQSYPFIYRTLDSLNMRVTYYMEGRFRKDEVYDLPVEVAFPDLKLFENLIGKTFAVSFSDAAHFSFSELSDEVNPSLKTTHYKLGDTMNINGCPVVLKTKAGTTRNILGVRNFELTFNDLYALAFTYKDQLNIRTNGTESSVVDIYLETAVPQKGIDFLNEFTKQYLNYKFEEKSRALSQSLVFIDDQLDAIGQSLGSTESNVERFKTSNTFSDASKMTDRSLDALTSLDQERVTLALNEKYYTAMLRQLDENKSADQLVSPSSVGIPDAQTDGLVNQLVSLEIERNNFSVGNGSKNPLMKDVDVKINTIRNTLKANITSLLNSNRIKLAQVNAKSGQHMATINSLPRTERKFVDINRENNLNEQMYLFLSQKKLEAGILKAATTVENKVIESAMLEGPVPLKPKKSNNYALALLAGLAFPFTWIWLRKLFNKKVSEKEEFQNTISLPFIGSVYHNFDTASLVMTPGSRTAISESFRLLRSHFTSINSDSGSKAILITSMDSGEGKSFCSLNIAASLALLKKKTILVNLDLRTRNSVHPFPENKSGISAYLAEANSLEEIICPTENPYLDYISCGEMQANASELLNDEKAAMLLRQLKKTYAYVIIDSPPLGRIADPFVIAKYTNLNLIIIRLNYTTKEMLFDLEQMYKEGKLKNAGVVLNDERLEKSEYSKRYYNESKPAARKFSLNVFKLL